MALKGKKCPRRGLLVQTKGGLIGTATGFCAKPNKPMVKIPGLGVSFFKKGELKAVPKGQAKRLQAEMARLGVHAELELPEASPREASPRASGPKKFDWNDPNLVRSHRPSPPEPVAPSYIEHDVSHLPMDGLGGLGTGTAKHPRPYRLEQEIVYNQWGSPVSVYVVLDANGAVVDEFTQYKDAYLFAYPPVSR